MQTATSSSTRSIQGRTVSLPVEVRDASCGTATYLVDAYGARQLLPCAEIDVVEVLPGRALLSIGCIDYRDNDLGRYNEISIAFVVRERSHPPRVPFVGALLDVLRGRLATYIHRLPVNESFTCEAGRQIWGFPKTVNEIDIRTEAARMRCEWSVDGERVFQLSLPRGGGRVLRERSLETYSSIEGVCHRTAFTSAADGAGFRLAGADLVLGRHAIADELRTLGLPKRALMTAWMERMRGRFEAPVKL